MSEDKAHYEAERMSGEELENAVALARYVAEKVSSVETLGVLAGGLLHLKSEVERCHEREMPEGLKAVVYHIAEPNTALDAHLRVAVEWRGDGRWAVVMAGEVLNHDGTWEYESSPSNRSEEFIERTRYDSPEAALAAYRDLGDQ